MDQSKSPRRLGRRRFLAGTTAATSIGLAGCLGGVPVLSTSATLGAHREVVQMDGRERHLVFGEGDGDVTVTLRQEAPLGGSRSEWIPFRAIVHHRDGLRTDRITLSLRAPPADGSAFAANVYLQSPVDGNGPPFTLDRTPDGWTVFDAGDLGATPEGRTAAPGDSNVGLRFVVSPRGNHPVDDLFAAFDGTFSERGTFGRRRRRATARFTFPFVRS